jgi:hypothetical protein
MIDTFLETHNCFNRLLAEYREHKKLIVAVDFDDTVFDYHQKGRTYEYIIALLRRCQKHGFWIVLFTACSPDKAESQKAYLAMRGIEVHSVNKNPVDLPFGNDGKIYFNILLDDRAGLGQAAEILHQVIDDIEYGWDPPWKKANSSGELPGDICCLRACGGVCYEHNPFNYRGKE